jgi:hypothetical protein
VPGNTASVVSQRNTPQGPQGIGELREGFRLIIEPKHFLTSMMQIQKMNKQMGNMHAKGLPRVILHDRSHVLTKFPHVLHSRTCRCHPQS